jgi:uncharacterized membrane protein YqiK
MIALETILIIVACIAVPIALVGILNAWTGIVRYIPNDKIGIVEKLFSFRGSMESGFIALNGEPGFQPEVVRGGVHFFFPFAYRVHKKPLVTISQGHIGYVFARDGAPLDSAQTLGHNEPTEDFQNVRQFLAKGGQKGPQRRILREGTHAINLAQFVVLTEDGIYGIALDDMTLKTLEAMSATLSERHGFQPVVIRDAEDKIGIVTVHDGPSLPSGEIIAPEVGGVVSDKHTFHDNFQRPAQFLNAGGNRGRQLQTLVEGTYWINRLFATVELIPKTTVEIGNVAVVISYAGETGDDVSGTSYRHGQLVARGKRGVWAEPLLPGKYAFNSFAAKPVMVPTTNFMLRWDNQSSGAHRLDENLSEISLITKDAFEPILPLSVVLHIDYQRAPELVQRFGDIKRLVEQTLDPMVASYFKNKAQKMTLIELLQKRTEIQEEAGEEMRSRFAAYSLEFQEVLIGTPRPREGDTTIETILLQLRQRQVAAEQVETYKSQEVAAIQLRQLNEAQATAAQQTPLTQSAINVKVRENEGAAALARAEKEALVVRVTAQATADRERMEGEGQAAAIAAIGEATAQATKLQVDAYGGPEYRLAEQIAIRMFEAVAAGHQPIVPQIMVGGGSDGASMNPGGLVAGLLASLLPKDRLPEGSAVAPLLAHQKPNGATA